MNRRVFASRMALGGVAMISTGGFKEAKPSSSSFKQTDNRLKVALNAYSFDKPLRAGSMSLEDLLDFSAETGFESVDLTAYYFPGYPVVPPDSYLYKIKKKAFTLGIELGCTGVKNDFTWSDKSKREEEKKLVRDWIVAAEKIGAPGVRIFAGTLSKESFPWETRAKWISEDIIECADFGSKHGVMVALQNHNDFLKDQADVNKMMEMINHEWVGLMLDIGSFHTPDPYQDIEATIRHAITWQIKEKVFINDNQVDTDFKLLIDIIKRSSYRGCLPLETLGEGDPFVKVKTLYDKVKAVL
jgi:sugar phosphate isomerase/epimerase